MRLASTIVWDYLLLYSHLESYGIHAMEHQCFRSQIVDTRH